MTRRAGADTSLLGGGPIGSLIGGLLDAAPVSGGTIAIARGGAVEQRAFGTRGPGGRSVEIHDRFEIGSISKTVAALAAARLEAEGVLRLDDPVRTYLPWLELPEGAVEPSLRHLLAHTAGWIAGNSASPGEIAQALSLPMTRAVTAPGERFHYSNVGYVVLGLALAEAAGTAFPRLLADRIFSPLGLPGALASLTGAERARLCPGTVPTRDDAQWAPGDPLSQQSWVEPAGADGNVGASARELLQFGLALTDPTGFASESAWLPAAVAAIATPTAPSGEDILGAGPHLRVRGARYGLGVNVEPTADGTLLTHGGGMIGYGAFVIAHPELDLTVAVLLSTPGEWPHAELLARAAHAELVNEATAGAANGRDVASGDPDPIAALRVTRGPLSRGAGETARLAGHYRSYTPWCPHYEVGVSSEEGVAGQLVLRAYSGVEAPTEDTPLVLIAEGGGYTVGAEPGTPERARFSNFIGGVAQTLDIDGCVYSRVVDR
ncbi:serine hydrolase domain-containing protein [Leucobacter aridicollis]|uniref:serine hydrolase domain-containing protein n=1 Tax=Leucobacter aridicollis TaxID=283878 RepID=UPI0021688424|nr:serine hydrolase domain-containing protein [Leucobacter aridicollis]MCS3427688.1 CubicO group peptidase (beta-lactamase class C family) [Leucobacter aridicollis]